MMDGQAVGMPRKAQLDAPLPDKAKQQIACSTTCTEYGVRSMESTSSLHMLGNKIKQL